MLAGRIGAAKMQDGVSRMADKNDTKKGIEAAASREAQVNGRRQVFPRTPPLNCRYRQ
jgi:hypothetical protein